jgi:hypothetical protein
VIEVRRRCAWPTTEQRRVDLAQELDAALMLRRGRHDVRSPMVEHMTTRHLTTKSKKALALVVGGALGAVVLAAVTLTSAGGAVQPGTDVTPLVTTTATTFPTSEPTEVETHRSSSHTSEPTEVETHRSSSHTSDPTEVETHRSSSHTSDPTEVETHGSGRNDASGSRERGRHESDRSGEAGDDHGRRHGGHGADDGEGHDGGDDSR